MPDDSLFGSAFQDIDLFNPLGGTVDVPWYDPEQVGQGTNPWDRWIQQGGQMSPVMAMMLQNRMVDPGKMDNYYVNPDTGEVVPMLAMWDREYGKYFDEYDYRKEGLKRRETYHEKKFSRKKKAKEMTQLSESFGGQGFVSTGDQIKQKENLFDSAVREQNIADIKLRKGVLGLHNDWQSGMFNMFAQLAGQGAFGTSTGEGFHNDSYGGDNWDMIYDYGCYEDCDWEGVDEWGTLEYGEGP